MSDMDLALLESGTRGRILAGGRVTGHHRIPVIAAEEVASYGNRFASCVRDLMSSLRNALRRWYSTVLALMNSRAAISRLV
jgi:hypothetical protein